MPIQKIDKEESTSSSSSTTSKFARSIELSNISFNWEDAPVELTRRCVLMEIYGATDTGRSTLALTAPGPIAYIATLEKLDGIIQKFSQSKKIKICTVKSVFRGTNDEIQEQASISARQIELATLDAYNWARTIIWDTHTEAWQIFQLARLGSLTRDGRDEKDNKKGQLVYTEINNRWRSILKEYRVRVLEPLQRQNTNLIIIGQASAEYKGNKSTGRLVRSGQKETGYLCDVIIRTEQDGGNFSATIEKPWYNELARDTEVQDDMLRFNQIMSLITMTSSEEWE